MGSPPEPFAAGRLSSKTYKMNKLNMNMNNQNYGKEKVIIILKLKTDVEM